MCVCVCVCVCVYFSHFVYLNTKLLNIVTKRHRVN